MLAAGYICGREQLNLLLAQDRQFRQTMCRLGESVFIFILLVHVSHAE